MEAAVDVGYRIVRPSGEERYLRPRAKPLRAPGDRVRYLGSIQDTTEQARCQREAGLDARLLRMARPRPHRRLVL